MIINERKISLAVNIFSIVLGALIACLAIFCYEDFILGICIMIGIGIILVNIYPLYVSYVLAQQDKRYWCDFVISILFIVLGFLFIFEHGMAVSIIAGCFCIALPIVRICLSEDKKAQAKKEIPLFIIGALMFFNVRDVVFRWALVGVGAVLVILGIVNIILSSMVVKEKNKKDPNVIDAEYKEL